MLLLATQGFSQSSFEERIADKKNKPVFKILTSGKKITVESKQSIRLLMAWTSSGHRIVEQRNPKELKHSFNVPAQEKIVYVLVETTDGKRETRKIGVN